MLAQGYTFLFNLDAQLLFDTVLLAVAVFFLFMLMSYLLFNPARKLLKDRQDKSRISMSGNYEVARKKKRENVEKEAYFCHYIDSIIYSFRVDHMGQCHCGCYPLYRNE